MTKKADAEAPGKPADEPTSKPGRERAARLTRSQVVAQHALQGGRCYVSGLPLGDDFVEVGGKLVSRAVNERRGGRSLGLFREKLASDLADASKLLEDFGRLRDERGNVVFDGEKAELQPAG
jgi:hypothetical protein